MSTDMARRVATRWIVSPDRLIDAALRVGLITEAEAASQDMREAAREEADYLGDTWPEGEGFGSSDIWPSVESMLRNVGIETDRRGGRLTRV